MGEDPLEPAPHHALEHLVQDALRQGDLKSACIRTIDGFGPEIYGFMSASLRDVDLTQEAFSIFSEDVWRGLAAFRSDSSLRTWLYAIARNACHRARRSKTRARLLLDDPGFDELEAHARSQTATFLRTEVKDAVRDLRDALSDEERELLVLRIDRDMSWLEIAQVQLGADVADAERLKRASAACRKRFERARERLRELAVARGLLPAKS